MKITVEKYNEKVSNRSSRTEKHNFWNKKCVGWTKEQNGQDKGKSKWRLTEDRSIKIIQDEDRKGLTKDKFANVWQTSIRINTKPKLRHITAKLLKTKDIEQILKAAREKNHVL